MSGHDSVKAESRWATPDEDLTVHHRNPRRLATARPTTEKKNCRNTQRNRDDRLAKVAFILVLMQREPRLGLIAIDETRIGAEIAGRLPSQRLLLQVSRKSPAWKATPAAVGFDVVIAVTRPVRNPSPRAAVGHGD